MKYGIKITNTNRYLVWIDDNWYETQNDYFGLYNTEEEVQEAIRLMMKHYQYYLTVVSDGDETNYEFGKKVTAKTIHEAVSQQVEAAEVNENEISLF